MKNKLLNKWGLIIDFLVIFGVSALIYFLLFVVLPYFLVKKEYLFDSTDKENFVQIALLAGALLAFFEAVKLRKAEYEPVLGVYIRDVNTKNKANKKRLKYIDRCFILYEKNNGKCLVIRNTGKGTAFNINILKVLDKKGRKFKHGITVNEIIAVKEEIVLKLGSLKNENLNGFSFIFSVESVLLEKVYWRFEIEDVNENRVKFVRRYVPRENILKL